MPAEGFSDFAMQARPRAVRVTHSAHLVTVLVTQPRPRDQWAYFYCRVLGGGRFLMSVPAEGFPDFAMQARPTP